LSTSQSECEGSVGPTFRHIELDPFDVLPTVLAQRAVRAVRNAEGEAGLI